MTVPRSAATRVVKHLCKLQSSCETVFDNAIMTLNTSTDVAQTPKRTAA
jgi:hypothetical protein